MKITSQNTHATVTRSFTIDADRPVVDMAHSSPPKKVRISRGVIRYDYEDGRWIVGGGYSIDISGTVLKQDGADSKNDHKRKPGEDWKATRAAGAYVPSEEFTWLRPIINLLRPAGAVALVKLAKAEVSE